MYVIPRRAGLAYLSLVGANAGAWLWALIAFRDRPLLLGTALLAYGLGVRHALDADHLAAIDGVTRKLMHDGRRPMLSGFAFSLGHSTVVILASLLLAGTASTLDARHPGLRAAGAAIGAFVSAFFLIGIGIVNCFVLGAIFRAHRRVRRGDAAAAELDAAGGGGVIARVVRPLSASVGRTWQMYPLGFAFGLGFDTASEIGLLGISAVQAANGLPVSSILIFPALFTTGMALVDTTNSMLMVGAYGWALGTPARRLGYNMTITTISVMVALIVGGIELAGLVGKRWEWAGWSRTLLDAVQERWAMAGGLIVGLFLLAWAAAVLRYRSSRSQEREGATA